METPRCTLYSVRSSRNEVKRERRVRAFEWVLVGAACVVIVVFTYLLTTAGPA